MAGTGAFVVEGVVIEAFPNRTYRVELANGHHLLAFVAGRVKQTFAGLIAGEKVMVQLSPYDLSSGRVLVGTEKILK